MKKKAIYPITALALAACLCLFGTLVGGAAGEETIDVSKNCSLTVHESDSTDEKFLADLREAGVVLDLYKVADVEKVAGYDTYSYSALEPYENLDLGTKERTQDDWDRLAQEAARLALSEGSSAKPAAEGRKSGEVVEKLDDGSDLGCGLYLLVARGEDLTEYTDVAETPEGGGEQMVTIARSARHTYRFKPQLISLPMKGVDADGNVNTANAGPWLYGVTVSLKPSQERRFGSLRIVKTLRTYETKEPGMFVFRIEAVLDGETVYSDVESLIFTAAGQQTIELVDKIPAGADVTVTEVYTGAAYELQTEESRTVQIAADSFVETDFTNDYTGDRKGGHGIVNQFDYSGTGEFDGWVWKQNPAVNAE
ncbi:MAG: hypothetical protein HFI64_00105 [Lachnospiraceae bacterium]|nr:hypothetical protein [Lachnospiraceae bacterium]